MAAIIEMPSELKDLRDLFRKIDKDEPDPGDIKSFREALESRPDVGRVVGDMAQSAMTHMIDSLEGPMSLKMSLCQGAKSLQFELGATESSPLEKL